MPATRIDLTQQVEWPLPEKPDPPKKDPKQKQPSKSDASNTKAPPKSLKRPRAASRDASLTDVGTAANAARPVRPTKAGGKENREDRDSVAPTTELADGATSASTPAADNDENVVDISSAAQAAYAAPGQAASKEDEIEKLRQGGSMTQNQTEVSRVRNLERIQMGGHEIEPWYFSPYPAEFGDAEVVHVCEFCLEYFASRKAFERHRSKCTLLHPPGNEIYRDEKYSFFEIDGRRQRTWCRNLCLLSKLFLDHKTLYYDVDPFLFYCMTERDARGCHLIGYFSKEKESAEGYNVACILTLPQYQRKGLGRLLIAFSYELSKRENKNGSPEKPLSDLGLMGYRRFWLDQIIELLFYSGDHKVDHMSIEDVAANLNMVTSDVMNALWFINAIKVVKRQHVICIPDAEVAQYEKKREKYRKGERHNIQPEKLVWKPPVFTAATRTWNW